MRSSAPLQIFGDAELLDHQALDLGQRLTEHSDTPLEQAARICHGVHEVLTYSGDGTSVGPTAAGALAGGAGVGQDFAHMMLAVCHPDRGGGRWRRCTSGRPFKMAVRPTGEAARTGRV
ncbi:MAG: hypothetical protein M3Y33_19760 [Actinomycetota bacterium]|nr:hypothetical protein [Actinomycetota bacterium]